jgi:hypothetical protein
MPIELISLSAAVWIDAAVRPERGDQHAHEAWTVEGRVVRLDLDFYSRG